MAQNIGFSKDFMFDSVDLYEEKNIPKVIRCLLYLGNFLNQMKLNFEIPEEPFYEFTYKFTNSVENLLENALSATVSAIVNHSSSLWVDGENFMIKDSAAQMRFENWNVECYNISSITENKPHNEGANVFVFDYLQNLYFSNDGRKLLESVLLANIKNDLDSKYQYDSSCRFLEKYKDEIIKFPSVFVELYYGSGRMANVSIPIESIINPLSSTHHIFSFVNNLLEIDSSDDFSLTLVPLVFFVRNSIFYKKLQNSILKIVSDIDYSIDPLSIYYEKRGILPGNLQKHNREQMISKALDDLHVRHEFSKRIVHFMILLTR